MSGQIAAQIPVISAAWQFVIPALQDHDLAAAWPAVDPTLRLCWAREWLDLNRSDAVGDGYDLDQVAVAPTDDSPNHPLWRHFPGSCCGTCGASPILTPTSGVSEPLPASTAVDIELLYLQDKTGLEGDVWQPGQERFVLR